MPYLIKLPPTDSTAIVLDYKYNLHDTNSEAGKRLTAAGSPIYYRYTVTVGKETLYFFCESNKEAVEVLSKYGYTDYTLTNVHTGKTIVVRGT